MTAAAADRRPIVVGHHPLASHGPHGDFVDPIVHVFPLTMAKAYLPTVVAWAPLPLIGSAMGWGRSHFSPSPQDFSGPGNAHFRTALTDAMARAGARGAPALVYAAGHDHSLQVFRSARGPRWTLVSGLGSSARPPGFATTARPLRAFRSDGPLGSWSSTSSRTARCGSGSSNGLQAAAAGVEMYSTSLTAGAAR